MGNKLLFLFCILVLVGCDGVFKRPRPAPDKYLGKYAFEFQEEKIIKIEYEYNGAVGGSTSISRIEIGRAIKFTPVIKHPVGRVYSFSSRYREIEIGAIKTFFISAQGNENSSLPKWFDMDFANLIEERTISSKNIKRILFCNPESNILYMITSEQ